MFGHNGGVEADALCLAQARFQMGHAAHLAAEADLADGDGLFVYRQVKQAGRQRDADRQVAGSLVQLQAADDVDVDILIVKGVSGALFQHGQKQVHAVVVKAARRAPRAGKLVFVASA